MFVCDSPGDYTCAGSQSPPVFLTSESGQILHPQIRPPKLPVLKTGQSGRSEGKRRNDSQYRKLTRGKVIFHVHEKEVLFEFGKDLRKRKLRIRAHDTSLNNKGRDV